MSRRYYLHDIGNNNVDTIINTFNKTINKDGYFISLIKFIQPFIRTQSKYTISLSTLKNTPLGNAFISKYNKHLNPKVILIGNKNAFIIKELTI
jgi:hypothetical protein